MGIELDKDMAATLTPEELAAINDSEMSDEELAALKGIASDNEDDDDDDDDDTSAADDKAGTESVGGETDHGKKGAEASDGPPGDDDSSQAGEPEAAFKPKYESRLPDGYDDQVAALNDEFKSLAQQFKDGDVDFDEYNTRMHALTTKREELVAMKVKADTFAEMNLQTAQQEWQWTVNRFVASVAKSEKIDYRNDPEKSADLDLFVRRLAESQANSDKPMEWFLQEAHKRVKALHGIDSKSPAVIDPEAKRREVKESRKPPVADAPKTLAQVPGSDGPGDMGNEFSDLDGLEGLELESAIARMTPAQRERYAKAM